MSRKVEPSSNGEKFWLVWNPLGQIPMRMHHAEFSAEAEAKRLATENQGKNFYVLEATMHITVKEPVQVTKLVEPLPF